MAQALTPNPHRDRIQRILHPNHALKRDDVVWVLDYIKKKVADKDPALAVLPQPRLIENFYYFAEVAMMLIHRNPFYDQECDRLKQYLMEALYGLDKFVSDQNH